MTERTEYTEGYQAGYSDGYAAAVKVAAAQALAAAQEEDTTRPPAGPDYPLHDPWAPHAEPQPPGR